MEANMNFGINISIVNNVTLLLAISIIYSLIPTKNFRFKGASNILAGCMIGLVGFAIMNYPFELAPGFMLDVRSILISISGLFMGLIPTVIAVIVTSSFRIYEGGAGTFVGVCVIVLSAIIGLLWRYFFFDKLISNKRNRWINIYLLGISTHIGMLLCFFFLPFSTAIMMLKAITIPVMIIYPVGTVLLGVILLKQIDNKNIYIQLDESERHFQRAVDGAPVPIMLHAEDGEIIKISDAWATISGYAHSDISTTSIWAEKAYGTKQDNVSSVISSLYYIKERQYDGKFLVKAKDGHTLIWDFYSANIGKLNDGRRMVMSVAVDITEQTKLEEEKRKINDHLNQQQRLESIGTLASGVAHEINNPINGIMNYSQLILDTEDNEKEVKGYAEEILDETNRVSTIVKNLLEFSRQEKQEFSDVMFDKILNQTLSLVNTIIKHDQIDLQIDIPKNMLSIRCRSQQIQQVLMNLLTNAKDALNKKYIGYHKNKIINISCKLIEKNKLPFVRITIEDHGDGIPQSVQDSIFDPFFTTKGRAEGTGLGLSISHSIIQEHQGDLTFETKEGEYTKFYVDLPVSS